MLQRLFLTFVFIGTVTYLIGQPTNFLPKGIGGGGALFSLSINPANTDEYYVSCDMGELFHTMDYGASYDQVSFDELIGGHNSKVCYTNVAGVLYSINYIDDIGTPVKSTDNGVTWHILGGNPDPSETTYSIHVDYNNANTVLISYYGSIYFSSNGGSSFTNIHDAIDSGAGIVVGGVYFDGNKIYIGTNDGVLVTTNGGTSWTTAPLSGIPSTERIWSFAGAKVGGITRFFCITADLADIYVGVVGSDYWGFAKGIYGLDYGSGSWVLKMNGIDLNIDFPMFVGMAQNDINTVYLAGSNDNGFPNIIKSSNGGATWVHVFNTTNNQNIATGWSGQGGDRGWGYGESPFGLEVAANDANRVLFGDFGFVHKTVDGGANWSQAYVNPNDENPAGMNTPPHQSYSSAGIENTSSWQVHWIDQDKMWACFSDIRGIRSEDKGDSWSFNYSGHSANSSYRIAQLSNGTLLAATSNIHDIYQSTYLQDSRLDGFDANGKIIYSVDDGYTWQDLKVFNHPVYWIEVDPNNENVAYASVIHYSSGGGIGGVYRTTNLNLLGASTWTLLPNPPRTEKHPACIKVLNDGKMVCTYSGRRTSAGTFTSSSGVFIYNPSNNMWTDVSHPGMYYWTKDIVVDPYDPNQNTWYAGVFSGWGGPPNGLGGLYKTTNRGSSWIKLTGNILDRVHSCTFNPDNQDQLFITTEVQGLWKSDDINGVSPTFQKVDAYPFQQPVRVFFNPYNTSEMWVSSFGNGMRKGTMYPLNCNIVNTVNDTGVGSLRYAIDCAQDGDTIYFANTLAGDTILLEDNSILINKSLTILNLNFPKVTIQNMANNLFTIQSNKEVWIENLVLLTGNLLGTCILNNGSLRLNNVSTVGANGISSNVTNQLLGEVQFFGSCEIK